MRQLIVTFLFLFLFTLITINAQSISGKISDKTDVISFADIILKDATGKIITGTNSDDEGNFNLKASSGNYKLIISFLGYKSFEKDIQLQQNLQLGNILLTEDAEQLETVEITATKRVIEKKIDRLVFNVEKSIVAETGNSTDLLNITPRVQVTNGAISILGKGNTRVLINGRLSPLEGDDLLNFLNSISANAIKSIEVITNPPAKYEATGNGGLLNIILKKSAENSWKNSISLLYNQNKYNYTTLRNNFYLQKNKVSLSFGLDATKGKISNNESIQIYYPENFWDITIDNQESQDRIAGRLFLDYQISEKTTIGAQYFANFNNPDYTPVTTSDVFDNNNQLEKIITNTGILDNTNENHSVNLHTTTKLDSIGKQLNIDVDYFKFINNKNRNYETFSNQISNNTEILTSAGNDLSRQDIENFSTSISLDYPTEKIKYAFGSKLSFTKTNSNAQFFNTLTGTPVLNTEISNEFMYNENNFALFASGNTKLSDKIQLKAGLRIESTQTEGENITIRETNENDYTKLFPSLFLSFDKNDNNNFNFSYSKRINRPSFNNLNPFRIFINDNSYSVGNPFLQPSFTDGFELSHTYKRNLSTTLFLNNITDGMGVFFDNDVENQNLIVTRENFYEQLSFGITESYSFKKITWWKNNNSLTLIGYKTNFTKETNAILRDKMLVSISSNNTFLINKSTSFLMNAWYNSKFASGLFSVGEMYNISFGFQKKFKNNFKLSITANDILNTASLNNYNSIVNNIEQNYAQNRSSRNLQISLSYDFGNKKINVRNRKTSNSEEYKRSN